MSAKLESVTPHGPNGGIDDKEVRDAMPRSVPQKPQSETVLTSAGLSSIAKIVGIVAIIVIPCAGFVESRIEIANQGAEIREMKPKVEAFEVNSARYELMVQFYEVMTENHETEVAYVNDLRVRMQTARIAVPDAPKLKPRPNLPPPFEPVKRR
jgi:hypothetical protein